MIEFADEGSHHDKKFNELLEADKKELEAFRLREESDVQQKRALIDKEYEKAKEENEPWWEKDIPTNRSMEGDAEEEKEHIADQPPPVEEPKEKKRVQSKALAPSHEAFRKVDSLIGAIRALHRRKTKAKKDTTSATRLCSTRETQISSDSSTHCSAKLS
jgi:hypothetical protein